MKRWENDRSGRRARLARQRHRKNLRRKKNRT